jgi:hypothetical protein
MYSNIFTGLVKSGSASGTMSFDKVGHFGLTWVMSMVEDIPDTRLLEIVGTTVIYDESRISYKSSQDHGIYLSYAFPKDKINEWIGVSDLYAGTSIKFISQKLFEYTSSGYGIDFGLLYTGIPVKGLRVGVNVQDINSTPIKWSTGATDKIPLSVKGGLAYVGKFPFTTASTVAVDLDTKYGMNLNTGLELWFYDAVALRVGFKRMDDASSTQNLTAGAGFKIKETIIIDYAFIGLLNNELGDSHRVSLVIKGF